jgi:hypothetical protein
VAGSCEYSDEPPGSGATGLVDTEVCIYQWIQSVQGKCCK